MPQRVTKPLVQIYNEWDASTKARFWNGIIVVAICLITMIVVLRAVKGFEYDTSQAEKYKELAEQYRKGNEILIVQVAAITAELQSNRKRDSAAIARSMKAIQQIENINEAIYKINKLYEKIPDFNNYTDDELSEYITNEANSIRQQK